MPNVKGDNKFIGFFGGEILYDVTAPSSSNVNQRAQYEAASLLKPKLIEMGLSPKASLSDIVDFLYCVKQSPKMDFTTEQLIGILNARVGHHGSRETSAAKA